MLDFLFLFLELKLWMNLSSKKYFKYPSSCIKLGKMLNIHYEKFVSVATRKCSIKLGYN